MEVRKMNTMKAPYKRGTLLSYNGNCVKYVRWWGIQRSSLIVVRFDDGSEKTVHVSEVSPV
jgi:hypothetical protein